MTAGIELRLWVEIVIRRLAGECHLALSVSAGTARFRQLLEAMRKILAASSSHRDPKESWAITPVRPVLIWGM
jgi:hypothetical protein